MSGQARRHTGTKARRGGLLRRRGGRGCKSLFFDFGLARAVFFGVRVRAVGIGVYGVWQGCDMRWGLDEK